jgi:hypothetical protein
MSVRPRIEAPPRPAGTLGSSPRACSPSKLGEKIMQVVCTRPGLRGGSPTPAPPQGEGCGSFLFAQRPIHTRDNRLQARHHDVLVDAHAKQR